MYMWRFPIQRGIPIQVLWNHFSIEAHGDMYHPPFKKSPYIVHHQMSETLGQDVASMIST